MAFLANKFYSWNCACFIPAELYARGKFAASYAVEIFRKNATIYSQDHTTQYKVVQLKMGTTLFNGFQIVSAVAAK